MPDDAEHKPDRASSRDKRRAEALRLNLKRRKAQLRGRTDYSRPADQDAGGDTEPAKDER